MPKPRNKENKPLPTRWVFYHGAYYYRVPKGMESAWQGKTKFMLGKTQPEAYKKFAEMIQVRGKIKSINDLLDRYALEVIPKKAPATQVSNFNQMKKVRAVFGEMPILPFPPRYVYRYVDMRDAKVAAKREISLLSHAYTKLVEWGEIDAHPFKGQTLITGEKPRDRYVEDWEIDECRKLTSKTDKGGVAVIQAYIELKLLTGLSRGDLLRLEPARQCKDDGLHIQRHKTISSTGKKTIYAWTPSLRQAIDDALKVRPVHISPYLFCTNKGAGYINEATGNPSGFKSLWQRFFKRLVAETKVKEHFTEHDLRAKTASDAVSLEHAKEMLSHSEESKVAERVYRRKAKVIQPAK